MALQTQQQLHFLLIPLMSQSHMIPITDFAILLAHRGLKVTIVTTPLNAIRFSPNICRAQDLNLDINLIPLRFPAKEAGLPDGCENMDTLPSSELMKPFYLATSMMQEPIEKLVGELEPKPCCIVSSNAIPWTSKVAQKFGIPRYIFQTVSCFTLACSVILRRTKVHESVTSDSELFVVPDLSVKVELTRSQLPKWFTEESDNFSKIMDQIKEANSTCQGIVMNSFEELETFSVEYYKKCVKNLWCIGPVSLYDKHKSDKFDRGNKAAISNTNCLNWLDSQERNSVIYACFGTLSHISPPQIAEIGLGLEQSNHPFIWIISTRDCSQEVEKWLEEEKFEERVNGRGLIVRGWAPQLVILSHPSIGGFLTHCGWNSMLEGISAGVPMITWPMFAEQFYNENLVVNVLRIGVRVGVEVGSKEAVDEKDVLVKREKIKEAINSLMDEKEGEVIRRRAQEVGDMAKKAVEEGGSSYLNISLLIHDVMQQFNHA